MTHVKNNQFVEVDHASRKARDGIAVAEENSEVGQGDDPADVLHFVIAKREHLKLAEPSDRVRETAQSGSLAVAAERP